MKTLKLSLLLAAFVLANSEIVEQVEQVEFVVVEAIKSILKDYLLANGSKLDLYYFGAKSEMLAEQLLREKPNGLSFNVIAQDSAQTYTIESPSILLYDSADSYVEMFKNINWMARNGVWHKSIVYAPKTSQIEVVEHFSARKIGIDNQNFIKVVSESDVELITNFKYFPGECNLPRYRTINRFSTHEMKWEVGTFFPEKHGNFHNCTLRLAFQPGLSTSISREIFTIMAKHLNFHLVREKVPDVLQAAGKFDLIECVSIQHDTYQKFYEFSSALYDDFLTFTAAAGKPYTQIEKMLMMLARETRIRIGIALSSVIMITQMFNIMTSGVKVFGFGINRKRPKTKVTDVFLNGGRNEAEKSQIARRLLLSFVMCIFIIKTCYQTKSYEDIYGGLRKPRFRTIDELNTNNFTLLFLPDELTLFEETLFNRK